jgi:hypothetical protein
MVIAHRRVSYFPLALLASVILGLLIGSAFPQRAHAANYWQFWSHIPVGSSDGQTVYLNCGWHSDCGDYPTSGSGLDWEETNSYAYFAGAAAWDNWYVTNAAYSVVTNSPNYNGSNCKNVVATIRNWYTGSLIAREVYTHVERSGSTSLTIYAYSSPWGIREIVGTVATSELSGCSWGGTHVHNYGLSFDATNSGGYPIWQYCYWDACASYDNGYWVHWEDWVY